MQIAIHEYVHSIQGTIRLEEEPDWDGSWQIYEMYEREIEAYNLSYYWYTAIFKTEPPIRAYTKKEIKTAKNEKWEGRTWSENVERFKKLESSSTLTYDEKIELGDIGFYLANHFAENVTTPPPHNNDYDALADLGCD